MRAMRVAALAVVALASGCAKLEKEKLPVVTTAGPHALEVGKTLTVTQNDAEQTFNLDVPGRADTQARAMRIEVSPSIAGSLFGALDYLTSYPWGCTEILAHLPLSSIDELL